MNENTQDKKVKRDKAAMQRDLKRKKRALIVCIILIVGILASGAAFGLALRSRAYAVKSDVKVLLKNIAAQNIEASERSLDSLETDAARLGSLLDSIPGRIASATPGIRKEMAVANALSDVANEAPEKLLRPLVELMEQHPLTALKGEDGELDLAVIAPYVDFASDRREEIYELSEKLNAVQEMPFGLIDRLMPNLRTEVKLAAQVSQFLPELTDELLKPAIELLQEYPLGELKTENGGFNLAVINSYIDFIEGKASSLTALLGRLENLDLGELDRNGTLNAICDRISDSLKTYERASRFLPVLKAFLGSGEDKAYLFAAQNSSEIRASGGFPGAMSIVRVRNGELIVEDFSTVTEMLYFYGSPESEITSEEVKLFSDWFLAPRDADFCPDYERVAGIWRVGYEKKHGERVDGVISATPAIIQRLLAILGEVTLSDGSVLNGENAVHVLEYELYYRYMSISDNIRAGNATTDALFAETAKTVLSRLTDNFNIKDALAYLDILEDSVEDRTLMLWFADEESQELVRAAGLDGGLDRDPAKPHVGIYFGLNNPSRLGWFLDIDPQITEIEQREDGSRVYSVTVSFTNTLTQDELNRASHYIVGTARGLVKGLIHFFAPAGGTISEVSTDSYLRFANAEYHGLELAYSTNIQLWPGQTVSASFEITTAPGEQEALGISMTPTLTAYR